MDISPIGIPSRVSGTAQHLEVKLTIGSPVVYGGPGNYRSKSGAAAASPFVISDVLFLVLNAPRTGLTQSGV